MQYTIKKKTAYLKSEIMLDDIQLFIHVAQCGSLKRAAEQAHIPLPTLSRRMHKLEQQLACLLFKRSTKGLTLTSEGTLYYDSCVWHVRELTSTLKNVDQSLHSLDGNLHVLAPPNFALKPLHDFFSLFVQKYPEIKLRVDLDLSIINFNQVPADLAIRIGDLPDSELIQTKLGMISSVLVCAQPSVYKKPIVTNIAELDQCKTIMTLNKEWQLDHATLPAYCVQKSHQYHTNDITFAACLAQSGAGIALLPMSEVYTQLESGDLIHVLPKWHGEQRLVSIIRSSRHNYSARAQCFLHELTNFIKDKAWILTR